jgi:sulfur relay (sulfurtransferase) complex TusBCD TusD component (DsrE family)
MIDRKAIVLLVTSEGMGTSESPDLKRQLVAKFLTLLEEMEPLVRVICFYTDGVKLVCTGSPVLDQLHALERKGMRLVICSTCLDYYGLRDEVQVGVVGGMGDIMTAIWQADKVVTV